MKQAIGLLFFRVVFQQYLLSACTSLLLFYHRLTIRNKKEELNRPSTFHPFSVAKI